MARESWQVTCSFGANGHGVIHIVKSLIHQLIMQQPTLISNLEMKYASTGRNHFKYPNDLLAISGIFHDIITDKDFMKAYIVVDGIDECLTTDGWGGISHLLTLIKTSLVKTQEAARLKWIISTNTSESVRKFISDAITDCLDRDLGPDIGDKNMPSANGIRSLLPKHISYAVSKVAKDRNYDDALHHKIYSRMNEIATSSSNFLWVSMVCRVLAAEKIWYALRRLNELPPELGKLYQFIGNELKALPRDDGTYCRFVLWTMSMAQRPLHVSELAVISGLGRGYDTDGDGAIDAVVDTETIVEKFFAFLRIDQGRVRFLNNQVKEYSREAIPFGVGPLPKHDHYQMADRCLQSLTTFFQEKSKQTYSIEYSLTNWVYHVLETGSPPKEILDAINVFLKEYLPKWLEAVVQASSLPTAVGLLRKLDLRIRAIEGINLETIILIEDAHRLFQLHESFNSPSDLPSSNTLLFCPTESPTRNSHLASNIPLLLQGPITEKRWTSNFLTLGGHTDLIQSMVCSPSSLFIVPGSDDKTVRVWDAETRALQHTMKGHNHCVRSISISITGLIASGSEDGKVILWEPDTGKSCDTLSDFGGFVGSLSFSPDGTRLAVAAGRKLTLVNLSDKTREAAEEHESTVSCSVFSPSGSMIATGSWDATVKIWDANAKPLTVKKTLTEHEKTINSLRFSPDSKTLAACSEAGIAILWDTATWTKQHDLKSDGIILGSAFFPAGSRYISSTNQNTIDIWDTSTGGKNSQIRWHGSAAKSIAVPSSGQYIVSSGRDCLLRFWYAHHRKGQDEIDEVQPENSPTAILEISQDGTRIASGLHSGRICLWDGNSGERIQASDDIGHQSKVKLLAFSPDGQNLVSASYENEFQLWDATNGKHLKRFDGHEDWVRHAAFSPDGKLIASASDDYTIGIWQVGGAENKAHKFLQEGHTGYCRYVVYSPDSGYVVSSGDDNRIVIWKTETWKLFRTIKSGGTVTSMAVTPDSSQILASLDDGTLRFWGLESGALLRSITTSQKDGFSKIFFKDETQRFVMTELGPVYIGPDVTKGLSPPTMRQSPYALRFDNDKKRWFITHDDHDIIFLPEEYQPVNNSTAVVLGRRVVIGCKSGRCLLFRFK